MFKKCLLVLALLLLLVVPISSASFVIKYDADVTYSGDASGVTWFTYGDGAGDSPCMAWDPPFYAPTFGAYCYEDYDRVKITYSITEQQYGNQSGTKYVNLNGYSTTQLWLRGNPRCEVTVHHAPSYDHNEFILYKVGYCVYTEVELSEIRWEGLD